MRVCGCFGALHRRRGGGRRGRRHSCRVFCGRGSSDINIWNLPCPGSSHSRSSHSSFRRRIGGGHRLLSGLLRPIAVCTPLPVPGLYLLLLTPLLQLVQLVQLVLRVLLPPPLRVQALTRGTEARTAVNLVIMSLAVSNSTHWSVLRKAHSSFLDGVGDTNSADCACGGGCASAHDRQHL